MKSKDIKSLVRRAALLIDGEYILTRGGVPVVFKRIKNTTFSIVYLAKENIWKAFYPYPSTLQNKLYFKSLKKLIAFFTIFPKE